MVVNCYLLHILFRVQKRKIAIVHEIFLNKSELYTEDYNVVKRSNMYYGPANIGRK